MRTTLDDPVIALDALGVLERWDEFSVQYSHPLDKKFWLRFELSEEFPYHITDLFSGHMTDGQVSQILYYALLKHTGKVEGNYRFSNLCALNGAQAERESTRIVRILELMAAYGAKKTSINRLSIQRGKHALQLKIS